MIALGVRRFVRLPRHYVIASLLAQPLADGQPRLAPPTMIVSTSSLLLRRFTCIPVNAHAVRPWGGYPTVI